MKRSIAAVILLGLLFIIVAGCGGNPPATQTGSSQTVSPQQWVEKNVDSLFEVVKNDARARQLRGYVDYYSKRPEGGKHFADTIVAKSRELQKHFKSAATKNQDIETLRAETLARLEDQEKWAKLMMDSRFSTKADQDSSFDKNLKMYDLLTKNYGINMAKWHNEAFAQLK